MKKKKIIFLLLFVLIFSGCVKPSARNQTINNNTNSNKTIETSAADECLKIWCVDSILVKDGKLEVAFANSYHYKNIVKKDGTEQEINYDKKIDYLEMGDKFVCGGDHEFESLAVKNIDSEKAIVEITEDFWMPGEAPGTNEASKECKISKIYQN